jgi:hypothetical protein
MIKCGDILLERLGGTDRRDSQGEIVSEGLGSTHKSGQICLNRWGCLQTNILRSTEMRQEGLDGVTSCQVLRDTVRRIGMDVTIVKWGDTV